ncbi:MAG: sulfatase [Pelagibacterium sp. SCN 64-44]|nr:MAG: sulfatase [Pelagibacterium sp. SCN 64-44]
MKVVFVLFDSLTRNALSCYGGSEPTPNFERLAAKAVTFDNHYVGSLPCMPARRDLQTGRLNFMHRSWGPMEPFDDSLPDLLRRRGAYTHLATDHYHYFEDGGATYHNRFTTYDFLRGQESDAWHAVVRPPLHEYAQNYHETQLETDRNGHRLQGLINRERLVEERDFPSVKTFSCGLDFLARNGAENDWFLQIEAFDPHEPFLAPERYRAQFSPGYQGATLDWPRYRKSNYSPEESAVLRANYAALVRMCDDQLGRLLDRFDEDGLWDDTALVLTTDHGFLLGEHDWWGKNQMPFYNEIAQIPLFIYHPRHAEAGGTRMGQLTQTIDIMPTILDMFGVEAPTDVTGRSIMPLLSGQKASIREMAVFGIYGGAVNVTDGRHTYFRYPARMETVDLFEYTLMPMHNRSLFETREMEKAVLHPPFRFTKNVPVLKIPALTDAKRSPRQGGFADCQTCLYDLESDPEQSRPFQDAALEEKMCDAIAMEMALHDAPGELYQRWAVERREPADASA